MTILTIAALVASVKRTLERDPALADFFVEGEVSNLYRSSSGHLYFTLKDADSSLKCVLFRFRGRAGMANNGDHVIVHGRMSVYEARGEVQIIADLIQPAGLGMLQLRFEQLKAMLEAEGLFDEARKRPIPPFPQRIALVTSPDGAVLHDIQTVIGRRYPLVELVLAPCQVQGENAPAQVVAAIEQLNARDDIDLIIVARGGGSTEDLWCFNEEVVARSIFGSRIPVISAIGHETDVTVSDYVADLRAPTPSAAAEICVPDVADLLAQLGQYRSLLVGEATARLADLRGELRFVRHRLDRGAPDLDQLRQRIDDLSRRVAEKPAITAQLQATRLEGLAQRLEALSPARTLIRGYAVVENPRSGTPVRGIGDVSLGEPIRILVSDGTLHSTVESVEAAGSR